MTADAAAHGACCYAAAVPAKPKIAIIGAGRLADCENCSFVAGEIQPGGKFHLGETFNSARIVA
jgi:hypothetical protein